jgi:tetratricopeptide (TPR) repeat protein
MLGNIYTAQKNPRKAEETYVKAIEVYETVLAKQPEMLLDINDLAFLLAEYGRKSGDLDKALALADKAMAQNQDNPAVMDTLGWVYYKKGNNAKALELLGKAQSKAQGDATINYHLGMALYKAGKRDQAKNILGQAIKSGEMFIGRDEAEKIWGLL